METHSTAKTPTFCDLVGGQLPPPPAGPAPAAFDGATYEPDQDASRLETLLVRVWRVMADGQWRTFDEIKEATGGSEPAISARLRDYRKIPFGAHTVDRRRRGNGGLYEYRLTPNPRHPWLSVPRKDGTSTALTEAA